MNDVGCRKESSPPLPRVPHDNPSGTTGPVEFDLHGLVGIRLVDASPHDAATIGAQIGPMRAPLRREPDVVIRFVDRLALASPLRLIGVNDAAFTDDSFVVLRSKHKVPARVSIPFDALGGRCEITCERGLPAVPLLIAVINLTALNNGALAMHASAFRHDDVGVLVTGWSKGGKTETLLGFLSHGAEYIGDEWIYLSGDGERMYGIPEPIRVWDWHLDELPAFRRQLGRRTRLRLETLRRLTSLMTHVAHSPPMRFSAMKQRLHRVSDALARQQYTHISPQKVFGEGFGTLQAPFDKVIFVAGHQSPRITVERISPDEIAQRMIWSLQEERGELMSFYRKYRFAHPGARNSLIDRAPEIERERLNSILRGKECYAVHHPHPVSIPALYEKINPLIAA